ncbi:MAG: ComEC/Rec2 family competence protein [Acidithiobacillus sp.]|nr:ComEC/Rec2 family competence protein [Acidithiobacillus sp.]
MLEGARRILIRQRFFSLAAWRGWSKSWPGLLGVALACEAGIILFQTFTALPSPTPAWVLLLISLALLLLGNGKALLPTVFALGFLSAGWQARDYVSQVVPAGQQVTVEGRIEGMPRESLREWRFQLAPVRIAGKGQSLPLPPLLELHGNLPEPPVPGQRWQLHVRTEPLSSLRRSPFKDLPRERFWQGILGAGKIQSAELLASPWNPMDWLAQARARIVQASNEALPRIGAGYIQALTVGIGTQLPANLWQIYRDTGTAHLLVISGSHVAVVTGFFLVLWRWAWRRIPSLARRWPAQQSAWLAAIPVAWLYAYLAGMQSPGERAAWMITVASLAALLGRRHGIWSALAFTAAIMAVLDPGQVIDLGYWLSILAVAILISLGAGEGHWRQAVAAQWRVSLLLLPLIAYLFGNLSLISPLANILVIPLIELIAVPIALLGAVAALLDWELLYRILFRLVALEMSAVTALLDGLRQLPHALVSVASGRLWAALAASLAFSLLLLPKFWPGRSLAYLGFVPLLAPGVSGGDDFRLQELPVGSGMALFWQQGQQTGLYTANLWNKDSQRALPGELAARLQKTGSSKLDIWVLGDLSHPQPLPQSQRILLPPGSRWPELRSSPESCAGAQIAGAQSPAFAPVQTCVLWLDQGRVLILGDLDEPTLGKFLLPQHRGAPKVIFAPASLDVWQRHDLLQAYPFASIRYVGEGKGNWNWAQGKLQMAARNGLRPYWELS